MVLAGKSPLHGKSLHAQIITIWGVMEVIQALGLNSVKRLSL